MTQKPFSGKEVSVLLQTIDPKEIADNAVRQTVELLLNLIEQGQRVSNPIDKRAYLISNQVGNKVALSGLG